MSLSPNLISSVTTVSFSLMIGTTPSSGQQGGEGRAGVEVALAVGKIFVGQRTRRMPGHRAKAPSDLGQPHLTDSGGSLQFMDGVGRFPAEALHAAGDGADETRTISLSGAQVRSDGPIR